MIVTACFFIEKSISWTVYENEGYRFNSAIVTWYKRSIEKSILY